MLVLQAGKQTSFKFDITVIKSSLFGKIVLKPREYGPCAIINCLLSLNSTCTHTKIVVLFEVCVRVGKMPIHMSNFGDSNVLLCASVRPIPFAFRSRCNVKLHYSFVSCA